MSERENDGLRFVVGVIVFAVFVFVAGIILGVNIGVALQLDFGQTAACDALRIALLECA